MTEDLVGATCSAPGCSERGTNKCSSCKITLYCCVACQTIDWPQHKEECQGRLLKLGEAHLNKAMDFNEARNLPQLLRYSELALTCLKKLHPRTLEEIKLIDGAMTCKYNALNFMGRDEEALECVKEHYSLWAAGNMRNPGMLTVSFALIESLIHNNEYEQAALIARTAYEMITARYDNIISDDERQLFLAEGSHYLARATYMLANHGGIAPEKKQKAGEEAITLARQALEIHTQLHGPESEKVADVLSILSDILSYFNGVDDDEVFRLCEQAKTNYRKVQGSSSPNVAAAGYNLGLKYGKRARASDDLDRCMADLVRASTYFREAARIDTTNNHVGQADVCAKNAAIFEEELRQIRVLIAVDSVTEG